MCNIKLFIKRAVIILPVLILLNIVCYLNVLHAQTRFNKIYNTVVYSNGDTGYLSFTDLQVFEAGYKVFGMVPDTSTFFAMPTIVSLTIDTSGNIKKWNADLSVSDDNYRYLTNKAMVRCHKNYFVLSLRLGDIISYPHLLKYNDTLSLTNDYLITDTSFTFISGSSNLFSVNNKELLMAISGRTPNNQTTSVYLYSIDTSGIVKKINTFSNNNGFSNIFPRIIRNRNKYFLFSSASKLLSIPSNIYISNILARQIDTLGNFLGYFYQGSFADSLYGIEDVIATKDGGFLIATQRYTYSPAVDYQYTYGVFFKLDSTGHKQWVYNPGGYRGSDLDWAYNVIELPCGDFMLSGNYLLYGVPFDTTIPPELNLPARFWHLSRITNNGELIWRRLYNYIKPNNYAYFSLYNFDLDTCPDKGFILSGYLTDYINELSSGWLVKVDSMGCLVPGCHLSPPEEPADSTVQVLLYPNPADQFINFVPQFFGNEVHYRLIDMLGRSVVNGTVPDGSTNMIDSRFLPAGTYLLSVWNDKKRITKKVVVQR